MKSIKIILLFPAILFFSAGNSQVIWQSDQKLSWNHFKMQAPLNYPSSAVTTTNIDVEFQIFDSCILYSVKAVFLEDRSWVKDSTDYILEHEQIHFDIAELFARKIRCFLSSPKIFKISDEEIREKIGDLISEKGKFDRRYDFETNHSINKRNQTKWSTRIRNHLKELQNYETYSVELCNK